MFCQLGAHIFELAKTPNSISHKEDFTFAEFSLINQANRLQPTGRGLREYSLGLYLHQRFCKVADEIAAFRKSGSEFEVLPLLWGNGKLEGDFVITSINTETRETDALGNVYAATLQIELKEYISNPAQKKVDAAQKAAFATGTKKNVVGKKTGAVVATVANNNPCNALITQVRQQIISLLSNLHAYHSQKDTLQYTNGHTPDDLQIIVNKLNFCANKSENVLILLQRDHPECLAKYDLTVIVQNAKVAAHTLNDYYVSNHAFDTFSLVSGDRLLSAYEGLPLLL